MADFVKWITACEGAVWKSGTFARVYEANRHRATADVIEADHVAMAVVSLMDKLERDDDESKWSGLTSVLLQELGE